MFNLDRDAEVLRDRVGPGLDEVAESDVAEILADLYFRDSSWMAENMIDILIEMDEPQSSVVNSILSSVHRLNGEDPEAVLLGSLLLTSFASGAYRKIWDWIYRHGHASDAIDEALRLEREHERTREEDAA